MNEERDEMMKHIDREEIMKRVDKEYEEFVRLMPPAIDWVELLLTAILTLAAVGGFSLNLANLIRMVVEHKFAYATAAMNIFWATVFLGQWVYHLAKRLKMM